MDPWPFHADELAAQARAGVNAPGGGIRRGMPDQHRSFFAMLPYIFIATMDADGWPVATVLTAEPGFLQSPDSVTLRVEALPNANDPSLSGLHPGGEVGVLGLDLATRRRNRVNGQIANVDATGFTVAVQQSLGNCPKYIQTREVHLAQASSEAAEFLLSLDDEARDFIERADTFFIASRSRPEVGTTGGADISHRGGRPGFVSVNGNVLTIPDFSGNRYFNTLGNLSGGPRASLLFIDFETGDVLRLQGTVQIDWSEEAAHMFEGAERLWHVHVKRGSRRRNTLPLRWSFVDYSPFTLPTGTWPDQ